MELGVQPRFTPSAFDFGYLAGTGAKAGAIKQADGRVHVAGGEGEIGGKPISVQSSGNPSTAAQRRPRETESDQSTSGEQKEWGCNQF